MRLVFIAPSVLSADRAGDYDITFIKRLISAGGLFKHFEPMCRSVELFGQPLNQAFVCHYRSPLIYLRYPPEGYY